MPVNSVRHCVAEQAVADNQAIDITTRREVSSRPVGFAETAAYDWLKENADTHGFRESYAENNDVGLMHEPWHWSHHK
jgi:LAS superfamily LD-carboxypeptidase LdcB